MTYTPGPWKVFPSSTPLNINPVAVISSDFFVACRDDIAYGEPEADANLIAAAPDLLDAVERVKYWDNHGRGPTIWAQEVMPMVEFALAKAKGDTK